LNLIEKAGALLLNLSQDADYFKDVLELNGVKRVVDNIKDNLLAYSKLDGKKKEEESKKDEDEEGKKKVSEEELILLSIQL